MHAIPMDRHYNTVREKSGFATDEEEKGAAFD